MSHTAQLIDAQNTTEVAERAVSDHSLIHVEPTFEQCRPSEQCTVSRIGRRISTETDRGVTIRDAIYCRR